MKILQLSKFYPPFRGGIETAAYELTEGLNRHGLHADVLCSNDSLTTQRERATGGYQIVRAASIGRLLSVSISPSFLTEAQSVLHRYDVIHAHMPDPLAALAVWLAKPKARLVLHWHSDIIRQRLSRRAYEPLQRWLVQRADAIIATSENYAHSSKVLRPWMQKLHVIPIGIRDRACGTSDARASAIRARHAGRKIVFGLGRMAHYKGFDVLIRAADQLPDNVRVLIGGSGSLFNHCRRQIDESGLHHKVHMLGHLSEDDLLDHYAAADVFCLPSTDRAEAFGVAMLEAMAMSKPIVSTRIQGSGVPWINQHGITGLTVPVGDPSALARALRRILDDDVLAMACSLAARKRYADNFTADKMTLSVIDLYNSLGVHP